MDLKDRKILYELKKDSNRSYAQIGRSVGLSKEVVFHRVKRMEEKGIIVGYLPGINYGALGYTRFEIFVRFAEVNPTKQKKFVESLRGDKNLITIQSQSGIMDLLMVYLTRDLSKFFEFLNNLYESELIESVDYGLLERAVWQSYKLLRVGKNIEGHNHFVPDEILNASEKDKKLIKALMTKNKKSFVEISQIVGQQPKQAIYHYKKLRKRGVIQSGGVLVDKSKLIKSLASNSIVDGGKHTFVKIKPGDKKRFWNFCYDHLACVALRAVINDNYNFIVESQGYPYAKFMKELGENFPSMKVSNQITRMGYSAKRKVHPF